MEKFDKPPILLSPQPREDLIPYARQIIYGIQKSNIFNIGIFGAYCSGKTSIIETILDFLKQRKNRKSLSIHGKCPNEKEIKRITLTHFDENNKDNNPTKRTKALQTAIIEQLFYGESALKLRWSRFIRLNRPMAYNLLATIISIIFMLAFRLIGNYVSCQILSNILDIFFYLNILLFAISFPISMYFLFTYIRKTRIKGIEAKGLSISFNEATEEFDRFLDDIIYFFSATKYAAIIFEDLDRFDEEMIYYKLRKLNYMINNAKWHNKRKITFIYALKDSLISNPNDRAKFFDLPIYITPFMSTNNSEAYIIDSLGHFDIEIKNKKLLTVLASRLRDYRQVSAFANMAFNGIRTIKNGTLNWLQDDKIIAMLIIRHCFPREFEDLQFGCSGIDRLYKECSKNRTEKIRVLNNTISEMERLPKDIFIQKAPRIWQKIVDSVPANINRTSIHAEYKSGIKINEQDISNKSFWEKIDKDKEIVVSWPGQSKVLSIEALTDGDTDLRLSIKHINEDLDSVRKDLQAQRTKTVWDFMQIPNDEDSINKCIWDLKNAGVLDDSYRSYVSPYMGGSVSSTVLNYIENNIKGNVIRADEVFTEAEWNDIIEETNQLDLFESLGFLNYSFIDCLIEGQISELGIADFIAKQTRNEQELLECFYDYLQFCATKEHNKNIESFTKEMACALPEKMLAMIYEKNISTDEKNFEIAIYILETIKSNKNIEIGEQTRNYLSEEAKTLCTPGTIDFYIQNNIKVKNVSEIKDNDCRNEIIVRGLFNLHKRNVQFMKNAPLEEMLTECSDINTINDILSSNKLTKELLDRIINFYVSQNDSSNLRAIAKNATGAINRTKLRITTETLILLVEYLDNESAKKMLVKFLNEITKEDLMSILAKINDREFKKLDEQHGGWIKIESKEDRMIVDKLTEYGIVDNVKMFKGKERAKILK